MAETVAIVDYGSGNLRSVQKALARAAAERGLAARIIVTDRPEIVSGADRVVLPGVGAFAACKQGLETLDGMIEALEQVVLASRRPFLGICVGMQLMAETGLEFGPSPGLGWMPGVVAPLAGDKERQRIPHMGWNSVRMRSAHPALASLDHHPADFYFVHSYCFDTENDAHVLAVCDYGRRISAIVGRDNLLGVQFHPEKSQAAGLALLADFLRWRP